MRPKQPGIVNLKGKDYATVGLRIQLFRQRHPIAEGWGISTQIHREEGVVIATTTITDPEGRVVATGTAEEVRRTSGVNSTSAVENAETSAIGRALACAGFSGDAGLGIASAEEVANAIEQQEAAAQPQRRPQPHPAAPPTMPAARKEAIWGAANNVAAALGISGDDLLGHAFDFYEVRDLDGFCSIASRADFLNFARQLKAADDAVKAGHDIAVPLEGHEGGVWTYDFTTIPAQLPGR
jgi:hypothetical protein